MYGLSCSTKEPKTLEIALANKRWKEAMQYIYILTAWTRFFSM
jgi:hypothetical protein